MLTGTLETTYGQPAQDGQSSFNDATGAMQKVESAVFSFRENRELVAEWTNADGMVVPVTFAVNANGQVVMSANPGQYISKFGGSNARLFCQ